jgi:hypothetical protein
LRQIMAKEKKAELAAVIKESDPDTIPKKFSGYKVKPQFTDRLILFQKKKKKKKKKKRLDRKEEILFVLIF